MAKLKDDYDLLQIKYEAEVESGNVEFKEREAILTEEYERHKKKAEDLEHLITEKEIFLKENASRIARLEEANHLKNQKDLVGNEILLNDESFKNKSRRSKTGSIKNIQINVCENIKCRKSDVDSIMCCACSRFVCEECNEVPVNKLKAIVKVCKNLSFSCNACISDNNLRTKSTSPESDGMGGIGKTDIDDLREEV